MGSNYSKIFYRDYEKLLREKEALKEKHQGAREEIKRLQRVYELERKEKERYQARAAELEKETEALKKEVARLHGLLNLDGTNSGTPTSQTPINKKKVIPNTREKSGKKRGGQPGHPKSKLKAFREEEITEEAVHGYTCCPECGGELVKEGERCKDELDYEVVVIKRRHRFQTYRCQKCHKQISYPVPKRLKEENQYGPAPKHRHWRSA